MLLHKPSSNSCLHGEEGLSPRTGWPEPLQILSPVALLFFPRYLKYLSSKTSYRCKQEGQGTHSIPGGTHRGASPDEGFTTTDEASRVIQGTSGVALWELLLPQAWVGAGNRSETTFDV